MKTFHVKKLNKDDLKALNVDECKHPNMELAECIEAGRWWARTGHGEAFEHLVICASKLPPERDER